MAKAAKKKKKTAAQAGNQRRHNKATKGSNSDNRPVVWDRRRRRVKGGYEDEIVTYPPYTMWDWSKIFDAVTDQYSGETKLVRKKPEKQAPLHEPFDTLLEDWEDGLKSYAFDNSAEIHRNQLDDGTFEYTVWRLVWNEKRAEDVKQVLLTVRSSRNCHFGKKRKFRKKNRG